MSLNPAVHKLGLAFFGTRSPQKIHWDCSLVAVRYVKNNRQTLLKWSYVCLLSIVSKRRTHLVK